LILIPENVALGANMRSRLLSGNARNMPGSWIDQMHAAANRTGHGFIHARVIRRMGDDALNFMTRSGALGGTRCFMRTNRTPDEWVDWCLVKNQIADELKEYYRACTTGELPPQLLTLAKKLDEELLKKRER
jgi:hypothetical protein